MAFGFDDLAAIGSFAGGMGSFASGLGGLFGGGGTSFKEQAAFQREMAQNGVTWRVQDAQRAGINPLAALGMQPYNANVIPVGGNDYDHFAQMGQGIQRMAEAKQTQLDRQIETEKRNEMDALQLENQKLQNNYLQAQTTDLLARGALREITTQQQVPPMPSLNQRADGAVIPGQAQSSPLSALTKNSPATVVMNDPEKMTMEAGSNPENRWIRTGKDRYTVVRGSQIEEALEDDTLGNLQYNFRNKVINPLFHSNEAQPPLAWLPDGGKATYWAFSFATGEWYPRHKNARWWQE
jgi:hypothetical protein